METSYVFWVQVASIVFMIIWAYIAKRSFLKNMDIATVRGKSTVFDFGDYRFYIGCLSIVFVLSIYVHTFLFVKKPRMIDHTKVEKRISFQKADQNLRNAEQDLINKEMELELKRQLSFQKEMRKELKMSRMNANKKVDSIMNPTSRPTSRSSSKPVSKPSLR
jgi:hypothetical protein